MKQPRLTVLGGGNGARAIAADMTLAGFEVSLFELPDFKAGLEPIRKAGGIELVEVRSPVRAGWAELAQVTTNVADAVPDADLILVCVPAFGLERMAEVCGSHLRDGQTVIHIPGGLSSYTFWRAIRRAGYSPDLLLADVATLPYGSRITGPTQVTVYVDAVCLPIAALPASRTAEAAAALQQLYPVAAPRADILDVALLNVNPIVHPGPSMLNTGRIEYADSFYLYQEGMTPSVLRVMFALDRERQRLREAWGYVAPHLGLNPDVEKPEVNEALFGPGCRESCGYKLLGPLDMRERYLTEDVPYGLVMYHSLAELVGVPMPLCDAFIRLASVMHDTDHLACGATLKALGLDAMSPFDIKALWNTPLVEIG